jgi:hypothetical protein
MERATDNHWNYDIKRPVLGVGSFVHSKTFFEFCHPIGFYRFLRLLGI